MYYISAVNNDCISVIHWKYVFNNHNKIKDEIIYNVYTILVVEFVCTCNCRNCYSMYMYMYYISAVNNDCISVIHWKCVF